METRSAQLKTERLVLKAMEDCDRESLLRIVEDDRVKKTYMLPDFEDQSRADAFFCRLRDLSAVSPLSPEEMRRLEAKNDALLKTVLHPAFQEGIVTRYISVYP